jgi:hypothetical protein
MLDGPARPFVISLCNAVVLTAAWITPRHQRADWRREWLGRIWHRWQFLQHAGAWNKAEQLRLVATAVSGISDAVWQFASQDEVRRRASQFVRSPWTCLGLLASALLAVTCLTGGLPATRQLIREFLDPGSNRVIMMWLQPFGGKPRGIPPDVVPDWRKESHGLESVSSFTLHELPVRAPSGQAFVIPVISSDSHLFEVLKVSPLLGSVGKAGSTAIDYRTWVSDFQRDPKVLGKTLSIAGDEHVISAVLPPGFSFLTRKATVYIGRQYGRGDTVMVVGRARQNADLPKLDKELARIARQYDYYFFLVDPKLRSTTLAGVVFSPVRLFLLACSISLFPMLWFSRVRMRHIRIGWTAANRGATLRRVLFFAAKLCLALNIVFVSALEWARPESSLLLTWTDEGSGLGIIWLYSLGVMAALFGAVADQRARCRVCLRLLAFPVRIGRPGSLLLDWGGTEFLCSEGHGVLHIPQLSTSWDEDADRWITLDDSWR